METKYFKQSLSCIDFLEGKKIYISIVSAFGLFSKALDQLHFRETHYSRDWS